jgi:signal transduction histidine kinase
LAATILLAIILGIGLEAVIGLSVACLASRPGTHVVASRWGVFVFNGHRAPIFMFHLGGANPEMLAARTAATVRLIASEPATDLPRIVAAATRPDLRLVLADAPTLGPGDDGSGEFGVLRRLIEFELGDPSRPVRVGADRASEDDDDIIDAMENMGSLDEGDAQSLAVPPQSMALRVEAPLPDGRWLLMSVPDYGADKVSLPRVALVVSPLLMLIGLLSVLTARRLAAPIREFVAAAERLGVDPRAPPLAEHGPHELRVATRAFNRMQDRLRRFVSDRTQMLAAMSHDLRTPLNRLRLRAELIDDDQQQKKMFADLEAMNAMIDSTLAFARDDVRRDPRRLVDLGVLVGDVCEDAVDAGAAASYADRAASMSAAGPARSAGRSRIWWRMPSNTARRRASISCARRNASSSRSMTTGRAFPPRSRRRCSRPSTGSSRRATRIAGASGSASASPAPSPASMAATSPSSTASPAACAPASPCRPTLRRYLAPDCRADFRNRAVTDFHTRHRDQRQAR